MGQSVHRKAARRRDGELSAARSLDDDEDTSGQLCTVAPVYPSELRVDDIVLCKVHGSEYLHLVKAIQDARFQIGNNRGFINGWIGASAIFGRLVKVED